MGLFSNMRINLQKSAYWQHVHQITHKPLEIWFACWTAEKGDSIRRCSLAWCELELVYKRYKRAERASSTIDDTVYLRWELIKKVWKLLVKYCLEGDSQIKRTFWAGSECWSWCCHWHFRWWRHLRKRKHLFIIFFVFCFRRSAKKIWLLCNTRIRRLESTTIVRII